MPDNPYLMDEKSIPSNWVDAPAKAPLSAPAPPVPHNMPQFFSGSMPPSLQHDTNFVGTEVGSPRIPKTSLMPLGLQANAFTNAAAQSTAVKTVIVPIVPPPTPAVAAVTDGLIHGDAIWEYDSAYSIWRDDFWSSAGGSSSIGELNWGLGGTGTPAVFNYGGAPPYIGQTEIKLGSTTANFNAFISLRSVLNTISFTRSSWDLAMPLFDYPGWKMTWIFCLRCPDPQNGGSFHTFATTHLSTYIGLGNGIFANGTAQTFNARPNVFFGCRFDTDTTAPSIGDTTFVLEACTNAIPVTNVRYNNQGTLGGTLDTGIPVVQGAMHRLEISCIAVGQVTITLDGVGQTFSISPLVTTWPNGSIGTGAGQSLFPTTTPSAAYSNTVGHAGIGVGGKFTTAGGSLPGPYVGTFTVLQNVSGTLLITTPPSGTGGTTGTFTTSAYPGVFPIACIANDAVGGTAVLSRSLVVDYFSLVWNKGLATGAPAPDSTLPRYW